ncbi:alcohol phosphatidyl transferase [Spathaspora passalidarum NRRL Y-27907]|uniref:diacylglycerol cholinephosphotransferase n=1 Tax=Spathaspora passalidarum (strain NRRL Y-27907 / 11-Y1) TaxID=619300 RepID=G3AUX5_SPAPN|nr:alcohol phosphatidyl transferase [Spathaspora passalidarum NRRL Y-27907]EGW30065.1 alcohol phosphatidyl transferase [Spathaspora passalidarum NRRL Y-27907]
MGLFIPTDKLPNLKLYKYSAIDESVISKYILKKWWNYFVEIIPMWVAPNMVTLGGLMFIVANLAAVFYYDPYLDTESPRWCYFFYAFGIFMYQTMDGCDGCHARRTGQSGPLGELFDHSIDAINTTLGALVFGSVMKMGYGVLLMISLFASTCNFYASTWEEYHTGTLFLSKFSGPVEGILMICVVFIITGIFGPDIWNQELFVLDLSSLDRGELPVNSSIIYVILGLSSLYFNIVSAMQNVSKYYEEKFHHSDRAKTATDEAYLGFYPFFIYWASAIAFIIFYPQVMTIYGFPFVISMGSTVAFSVGRIIVAHVTHQEFPFVNYPMFVPVAQFLICKFLINVYGYDTEKVLHAICWLGCGFCVGLHTLFFAEIIQDITAYLDIWALSIKHKRA